MTFMQKVIYDSIEKYINKYGESPSYRKIGLMAGLSSPATVHRHIHNLIKLGYIEMEKGKAKSIVIKKGKDD